MLDQQKKNDVKKIPSILVWMIIIINMFFSLGFFIALNQKIDGIRRVEKMVQLRKEMQDKNTGEWKEIKAKTFIELIDELGLDKDFFLHDRHNLEGTVFYPIEEKEKSSVLVWKSSQKVFLLAQIQVIHSTLMKDIILQTK